MYRKRSKSKASASLFKKSVSIFFSLLVLLLIAGFILFISLRRYIQSDEFRQSLELSLSRKVKKPSNLSPLKWEGLSFTTDFLEFGNDEQLIKLANIQGEIGINNLKNGYWDLQSLQVRKVSSIWNIDSQINTGLSAQSDSSPKKSVLPNKVHLNMIDVFDSNLRFKTKNHSVLLQRAQWQISQNKEASQSYMISLKNGELSLEDNLLLKSTIHFAKLRIEKDHISLLDSDLSYLDSSNLSLRGEYILSSRKLIFDGELSRVPIDSLLKENWKHKFTGSLHGTFQYENQPKLNGLLRGQCFIENAQLKTLPILDDLAEYTKMSDFRHLNFDIFQWNFDKQGETIKLRDIQIIKKGLLSIKGAISITGNDLDGSLQVGITPGTLNRIPGAETKVFTERKQGMLWTNVAIGGTLQKPTENLKQRLYKAAGERMLEIIPQTASRAIDQATDLLQDSPKNLENTAIKTLQKTEEAIEEGTKLLFDFFRDENNNE